MLQRPIQGASLVNPAHDRYRFLKALNDVFNLTNVEFERLAQGQARGTGNPGDRIRSQVEVDALGDPDLDLVVGHRDAGGMLEFVGYDALKPIITHAPARLGQEQRDQALGDVRQAFLALNDRPRASTARTLAR